MTTDKTKLRDELADYYCDVTLCGANIVEEQTIKYFCAGWDQAMAIAAKESEALKVVVEALNKYNEQEIYRRKLGNNVPCLVAMEALATISKLTAKEIE